MAFARTCPRNQWAENGLLKEAALGCPEEVPLPLRPSLTLLALALPAAFLCHPLGAQTADCTGVAPWIATTSYPAGAKVTYAGGLYRALVATTNVQPSYCPACGWWVRVGICGGTCTAVPAVPAGLKAALPSAATVTLTWTAVAPPANCPVTYAVYRNGALATTVATPSATLSGLAAHTSYRFTVAARDAAGSSVQGLAVTVQTPPAALCAAAPAQPQGLSVSGLGATGMTLAWVPVATPANCAVTYHVFQDGVQAAATSADSAALGGLAPARTYTFTVAALDAAGASSPSAPLTVTTPAAGPVATTGTLGFHLLLGQGPAMDQLTLDGDTYTDLILSNLIAGVMYGHLLESYTPGLLFDKDYLYGSLLGQLLQENIATEWYRPGQDLIDPDPGQQAVMGVGQGGPYQINNYGVDMVTGTYAPGGYSLINYVALQKNLGYTLATAANQHTQVTPPSFNNKYFGPMLPAYFHYTDYLALTLVGKGPGGWTTPWQPAYDEAIARFRTLPDNFLDMLLNAAYNQGYYGPLVSSYSALGATATAATVAKARAYASVWGSNDSYQQYPYQVMYYLDQVYDNPIPTTSASTTLLPANHIAFTTATLEGVFAEVMATLGYVDGAGKYQALTAAQADTAFGTALAQAGVASGATLDLGNAAERAQTFKVLEGALGALETNLGMKFNATTRSQL